MTFLGGCSGEQEQATQPARKPTPVTVVKIAARDTPVSTEFVGKTASSRRVEVRSRIEGFLQSREYEEGTLVQEGQVMFQMDRKPFEAQLQAAKAELDLGYTTIKAPVTGLSSYAQQREGAYIGIGNNSLLTYVARVDPIWVEFSVSENQILQARRDQKDGLRKPPEGDHYEVEIVLADGSVFPDKGRITFADASLSEETGTFLLRAELPNPLRTGVAVAQLRPGQFVRVHLRGAVRPNAVLVPQRAVQQGAKGSFVWVIDDQNEAEFRPIKVGGWQGEDWFIDAGLEDGETVVVDGALKLRAGAKVEIVAPQTKEDDEPEQSAKAQ